MNNFTSWVGDKKALREEVVRRFPLYYERYIEVFGGGGWMLFHKNPGNDPEVYNDFNGLLTNLHRCIREKPDLLMGSLRYVLNAREDFDRTWLALQCKRTTSAQRVAWFYQIIRQSYASALISFGNQLHDLRADFPLIEQAHRHLARAVIENKDFEKLIRHYDRPESLSYCDPPYHCMESHYSNIREDGFTKKDHIRLRDALMPTQGKFLLFYSDDPFVWELYDAPGIQIKPMTCLNSTRQWYNSNCQFVELLTVNCDLHEREWVLAQLNLFDFNMKETDYEICKRNRFQRPSDPHDSDEALWL